MSEKPKNKFLLACPSHFHIYELIHRDLVDLGYDVTIILSDKPFQYKNLFQKAHNSFRKTILGDQKYKADLKKKDFEKYFLEKIATHEAYDFCLFLRADMFENRFIQIARSRSKRMVSYHYDGLERYPMIFDKVAYFDEFFVFDSTDIDKYKDFKFKPATNFYFESVEIEETTTLSEIKTDLYYLGSYDSDRVSTLNKLLDFAQKRKLSTGFEMVFSTRVKKSKIMKANPGIRFLKHPRNNEDYLKMVRNSNIIVDIVSDKHTGLSFRVFEALKHRKKLITTNLFVMNYDLFHPDNIFILRENNLHELDEFINQPYKDPEPIILKKYGFRNWLSYVFFSDAAVSIGLPSE